MSTVFIVSREPWHEPGEIIGVYSNYRLAHGAAHAEMQSVSSRAKWRHCGDDPLYVEGDLVHNCWSYHTSQTAVEINEYEVNADQA